MLEIEQKYSDADFAALERVLATWGITSFVVHDEEDQYLAPPDRDFKITGEAFRLRRIGASAFFTYKGPRLPGPVKARTELELPLPVGDDMPAKYLELFRHLGYRPVAVVRKKRKEFSFDRHGFRMQVCLDEVENVGRYAEVEIVASQEELPRAETALQETAAALGLSPDKVERRSYLTMLLARVGS